MFPNNDDVVVYDFFAIALNIRINHRSEDEEQKLKFWESSAALSLIILVVSNTVLLGFFIWIFTRV